MSALRSLLFNIAFFGWTALLCIGGIPLLAASAGWIVAGQRLWAWGVIGLLRLLIGTDYQVSGRENLPDGPFVIAAKHQSAWETIIFFLLIDRPAYVLKKELLAIPLYGWYARRGGHIAVDRKAGAKALRLLLEDSRRAIADGMVPVIFPQGTRTAPGTHLPYQPGIAALYRGLDLPVVPVALNSGLFWGRRAFRKRPGTIKLEFLPAIPPGMDRAGFMAGLETAIEQATDRLVAEGLSPEA
ncbi:lysophospholipid acyltransferase family protein [Oceanibaculum nanhaiense]|uniref:lysophospholipid acyltransferase family protein n=1 Tax=Oceanibaculum nanhaiense TaxID=1909734 RepID=UPI0025A3FD09|nr:lysophospholipid acyltransferase family protein [Oceanibaculum nanhaiense]MDM7944804.1 lysophospholipid acyltransferase family protein [Oceanibaculum nanhaiense]